MTDQPKPRRVLHMPWAGPLPPFREQLPGETVPDYLEARGLFHSQAAKQQKVAWMLDRWLEELRGSPDSP